MKRTYTNIIVGLLRIGAFLQREGDKIVNKMIADSLGYEFFDINELFDLNI